MKPLFSYVLYVLDLTCLIASDVFSSAKNLQKASGLPVNKKELKAVENPLDYLAKYCLIQ